MTATLEDAQGTLIPGNLKNAVTLVARQDVPHVVIPLVVNAAAIGCNFKLAAYM